MIQKLFPLDKNYILRQAQSALQEDLLDLMAFELKRSYTIFYNPLRLMDETYAQILDTMEFPKERASMIYQQLAGIYRYLYGSNQLELLFDGRSHFEKFQEDWRKHFLAWIRDLGQHESYVKPMLRMTLLFDTDSRAEWSENRCKAFINEYYNMNVVKRKGELKLKSA